MVEADMPSLTFYKGTYHRIPTGATHQPYSDLESLPFRREDLMRLCAPPSRTNKLKGISGEFSSFIVNVLFAESKFFPYAIADNGPIEAPQLRYIFKRDEDQLDRNQKLAKQLAESGYNFSSEFERLYLDHLQRKRSELIEGQFSCHQYPNKLNNAFDSLDRFIEDFLDDHKLPKKLVYKPSFGANGTGVLILERLDDGKIKVQALKNNSYNANYLLAYSHTEAGDIETITDGKGNGRKIVFKINNNQAKHLKNLIDLVRVKPYKPCISDQNIQDRLNIPDGYAATALVDYGMVQDYHEFLKLNGETEAMIEGRYRFNYEPNQASFSIQKDLSENRSEGSYLKVGTNDSFVNQGNQFIAWNKGMHSTILQACGLEDPEEDYKNYMEKLLESYVKYYIESVLELVLNLRTLT